jgi:hypothetical protein
LTGQEWRLVLLGAKYRFVTPGEDDWFPQVAFYPAVLVPTGNQKFGFSSGPGSFDTRFTLLNRG